MVSTFLMAFIPLFVAIDAIAIVPLFVSMTENHGVSDRKDFATQATLTAFVISVLFLVCGKFVFSFMGITSNDFRIGGGIVLLTLSVNDLLFSSMDRRNVAGHGVGIVPLGTPLIMGPAALTTIMILVDSFGTLVTFTALIVNLAIVWIAFWHATRITRLLGTGGSRAFGKVASLFLAAIAIMMIRVGVVNIFVSEIGPASLHPRALPHKP